MPEIQPWLSGLVYRAFPSQPSRFLSLFLRILRRKCTRIYGAADVFCTSVFSCAGSRGSASGERTCSSRSKASGRAGGPGQSAIDLETQQLVEALRSGRQQHEVVVVERAHLDLVQQIAIWPVQVNIHGVGRVAIRKGFAREDHRVAAIPNFGPAFYAGFGLVADFGVDEDTGVLEVGLLDVGDIGAGITAAQVATNLA